MNKNTSPDDEQFAQQVINMSQMFADEYYDDSEGKTPEQVEQDQLDIKNELLELIVRLKSINDINDRPHLK